MMGVLVGEGGGSHGGRWGLLGGRMTRWWWCPGTVVCVYFPSMKLGKFFCAHANSWMLFPPAGYWSNGWTHQAWREEVAGARAWLA